MPVSVTIRNIDTNEPRTIAEGYYMIPNLAGAHHAAAARIRVQASVALKGFRLIIPNYVPVGYAANEPVQYFRGRLSVKRHVYLDQGEPCAEGEGGLFT